MSQNVAFAKKLFYVSTINEIFFGVGVIGYVCMCVIIDDLTRLLAAGPVDTIRDSML